MTQFPKRNRRSVMVTPGEHSHRFGKAAQSEADVIWLELEDGTHWPHKDEARDAVAAAMNEIDWHGKERAVRVNQTDSPWFEDDMKAIVPARPDAIIVPKARTADDVLLVERLIREHGGANGDRPPIQIGVMIESPDGLLNVREIATASALVSGIWFGAADYSYGMEFANIDMGMIGPITSLAGLQPEILYARSEIVNTARALGLYAIDVSYAGHTSLEGCFIDALWTFRFGFDGKMCITPHQVPVVHRAHQPTAADVAWGRAGMRLNDEMDASGKAVATLNEYAIFDGPFVKQARRILERAAEYGVRPEATD